MARGKKKKPHVTFSEVNLLLYYTDFKALSNLGWRIYFEKNNNKQTTQVYTTRDTEPFIQYFHWLHSNVRFVYFNDCVKYSSCKVSEIFGFPPAI